LSAILLIEEFTQGIDFEAFQRDPKTIAAVERKLQIISEAATRLGLDAEQRCPDMPWADIRGMGNWLRHRYDRVELDIVWTTVTVNLPVLAGVREKGFAFRRPIVWQLGRRHTARYGCRFGWKKGNKAKTRLPS
jgi:uncharacterized protein with HEPN domain